ncbi:hypothetical protein Syun_022662 [Stephania yunnanensis]|uniref:Uncharacterized protein n=1 Tax=Stephania yunnanensis TaxID=152371 RepID=A0AAP0I2X4_9MAGN
MGRSGALKVRGAKRMFFPARMEMSCWDLSAEIHVSMWTNLDEELPESQPTRTDEGRPKNQPIETTQTSGMQQARGLRISAQAKRRCQWNRTRWMGIDASLPTPRHTHVIETSQPIGETIVIAGRLLGYSPSLAPGIIRSANQQGKAPLHEDDPMSLSEDSVEFKANGRGFDIDEVIKDTVEESFLDKPTVAPPIWGGVTTVDVTIEAAEIALF